MRTFDTTLGAFVAHKCTGGNEIPSYTGPELYGFRFEQDTEDPNKGIGKIVTSKDMLNWTVTDTFNMADLPEDPSFKRFDTGSGDDYYNFLKVGNKFIFAAEGNYTWNYYVYDADTKELAVLPYGYSGEPRDYLFILNDYVGIVTNMENGASASFHSKYSKDLVEWKEIPKLPSGNGVYFGYISFKNGKYTFEYNGSTYICDDLGDEWVELPNNKAEKAALVSAFKSKNTSIRTATCVYLNENNAIITADKGQIQYMYDTKLYITFDGGTTWTCEEMMYEGSGNVVGKYVEEDNAVYIVCRRYNNQSDPGGEYDTTVVTYIISFNDNSWTYVPGDITVSTEDTSGAINKNDICGILTTLGGAKYLDPTGSIFIFPSIPYGIDGIACSKIGSFDASIVIPENMPDTIDITTFNNLTISE